MRIKAKDFYEKYKIMKASIKGKVIEKNESSFVMEDENGTQYVVSKGSGVQ